MSCPLCGRGKPRRACPALAQTICSTCCGTKRLSEIQCLPDCGYLASSREHPAAVVRRQQGEDVARLLPFIRTLTERQYQLFFLIHSVIAGQIGEGLTRLVDESVAEAAGALAATMETASRGVIYEHAPQSIPAQRLVSALKGLLVQLESQNTKVYNAEVVIVLRAIEQAAKEIRLPVEGDSAYLTLIGRLIQAPIKPATPIAESRIIT